MKLKILGSTGLRVSELCLGTMTFGEEWGLGAPPAEAKKIFEAFVAAGGNFFDTANNYNGGAAEKTLGELVRGDRDRYVIASKYSMSEAPGDPNGWGNHRKNLRRTVEASLRRLGTEYIDLYQIHIWDHTTPIWEVMSALDDLVRSGKVLHVGISDAPAWVVAEANTWAIAHGKTPFSTLQIEYSLIERSVEHELVPMANAHGLPILAWSPLASGVLAGKFHGAGAADSKRGPHLGMYLGPRADRIVPVVQRIAAELGVLPAPVALAWVQRRGPAIIPILGARREAQLLENLAVQAVTLTDAHLAELTAVSAIEPIFPGKYWQSSMIDGVVSGGTAPAIEGLHRADQ